MRRLLALALLLAATAAGGAEQRPGRGLRAEVAALLVQGVAGGSLPLAAAVFPDPAAANGEAGRLAFLLELPPAPPAAVEGERPVEVYAYAVDGAGDVVAHFARTLPDWPAEGEGIKVAGRLETSPGELSLRFLAWDPTARRYGMTVRRVAPGAAALTPRVAEECADWSLAEGEASELTGLSARPVLVSGEAQRLRVDRPEPPGGWRVRLTRERGGAVTVEEAAAALTDAGELEFVVPALAAGIYQLSVVGDDAPAGSSLALEAWLVPVLPPADGGCRRSWGRVLRLAREGGFGASAESAPAAAEAAPDRRLERAYEALLTRLAAVGDLAAAARELAELEEPIVAEGIGRLRQLFLAELKTARALAARDPRCLLPLVALHAETYRMHHGAGRFPLATHSRRLAGAIAELAADVLTAADEQAMLAVAITGLADMVETRRSSIEAQRLLERALSLDATQEAARLLLAVSYERKGRYADARRQLESLVAANSAHYEARVRLGILLRRIGEGAEAERLLRAVVAERPPRWLLSLAYQTLAQLLIREARLAEVEALLEAARRRLPEDQVLGVLQAYAQDRAGERQAAQQTLAELPLGEAAVTPRYRYSDEPAAELGLLRETLRQSITVRWPVLALALAAERPGGEAP